MRTTMIDLWDRLTPATRATIRTACTVALNGGGLAISFMTIDPDHFNVHELRHVAAVFGGGALVGIINWLRKQPRQAAEEDVVPLKKYQSTFAVLLAVALAGAVSFGCASLPVKQQALTVLQSTETALGAAQDFERALCSPGQASTGGSVTHCDGPNAAAIGLTDAVHRTIAGALAKAFTAQANAAAAAQAWQAGQPAPASVADLQADVDRALTTAKSLLPNPSQQALVAKIQAVVDEVATLAKTFTGGL